MRTYVQVTMTFAMNRNWSHVIGHKKEHMQSIIESRVRDLSEKEGVAIHVSIEDYPDDQTIEDVKLPSETVVS